jgi:hypothetical protein
MATTTTNFGWDIPQSTDLVKDGATAIAALGQDIDTAFVDLKGGTTGQVLAKASNTDLDYSWVAQDDSNAIQNAIVDAKGDLIAASASDVPARLAVGANGETLVADSSQTTGLAWAGNYAAGKNKFINGDFNIWQRGTSQSSGGFLADRFNANFSGATTVSQSRQTFTPGTAPVAGYEGKFFGRYVVTTAGAATEFYLNTFVEDVQNFAGQTATISFWVKADSTRTFSINVNQVFGSGGSGTVGTQIGTSFSVTTSWQRITRTVTIPSISGKTIGTNSHLQFFLFTIPTSGLTVDTWGWQVEQGSVATTFQTATGTIQGELAACQRYYYRGTAAQNFSSVTGLGTATSTTACLVQPTIKSTLRAIPTTVDFSGLSLSPDNAGSFIAVTAATISVASPDNPTISLSVASGLTQFRPYYAIATTAGGYLGIGAEL